MALSCLPAQQLVLINVTDIMGEIRVEMCSDETHLFTLTADNCLPVPAERRTHILFPCFQRDLPQYG